MEDQLITWEGKTYKYSAKEIKYYIRTANRMHNAAGPGWYWQPLATERVPKGVKQQKERLFSKNW